MKLEHLLQESSDQIQIMDYPSGTLKTMDGEPVKYLYRTVSKEEYDTIKKTGGISPSAFYGRIHAAAVPVGGDDRPYKVLKIEYSPQDQWKPKRAGTGDVYAVTYSTIPMKRIVETLPPSEISMVSFYSDFRQYMEYQT